MKIFLSFLQSKVIHPIPAYSFWEYYIKNGIEEAGDEWIECVEVDWANGLIPQTEKELSSWKAQSWDKTLAYIKKDIPDIFLSYLYPEQIDEQALLEIKRLGVKTINFFCDNVRMFNIAPKEFGVFDLNWVPEYKASKLYKNANLSFINLPMPMWVDPKNRSISSIENNEVSFIGSKDIQRQLFFEQLVKIDPRFDINIYGNGWIGDDEKERKIKHPISKKIKNQINFIIKNGINAYSNKIRSRSFNPNISDALTQLLKGKPSFDDYIKITRESKITIGINRYPSFDYPLYKPNTYSKLRDIEAPMLGACYLTEWTEGIDNLYDLNSEVLTYKTVDELIETCDMLSNNSLLRRRLRLEGQRRALNEHSIPSILKRLKN